MWEQEWGVGSERNRSKKEGHTDNRQTDRPVSLCHKKSRLPLLALPNESAATAAAETCEPEPETEPETEPGAEPGAEPASVAVEVEL